MANAVNIFDRYGIKEVANVYFEALEDDAAAGVYAGDIVLFLDTLKVSTIETTAENTAAQGGWGNPKLIQWDYGKEINITLEDALMSLESLRFMLGGAIKKSIDSGAKVVVRHTAEVVCKTAGVVPRPDEMKADHQASTTHPIKLINLGKRTSGTPSESAGARTQLVSGGLGENGARVKFKNTAMLGTVTDSGEGTVSNKEAEAGVGDHIRIFWETEETGANSNAVEVTISPDTFPGTYRVVGDTLIRSEKTGADEPFQFVIDKAKVQSNVTITLQAEGDPSTFEMTLNVLRSTNDEGKNEMMKLIRYGVAAGGNDDIGDDIGSLTSL